MEIFERTWPWYISGPLIGLMVPLLLLLANKQFGISSSLRHICAACAPGKVPFFRYNWKNEAWNLFFVFGILLGGYLAAQLSNNQMVVEVSDDTKLALAQWGITNFSAYIPTELFNWNNLVTSRGFLIIVLGGFMVGFGARYAGGCTSGHAIMGLSYLQLPSFIAVIGFFIGGLLSTHVFLPLILQ